MSASRQQGRTVVVTGAAMASVARTPERSQPKVDT
jgi:hypothetical protein